MHDTGDVQQMGIWLVVYKREMSLRTPAAEYTGLIALCWRPTQSACLVHIDLQVWSYLSPNQDQFMEAEVEEKEREEEEISGCLQLDMTWI